VPEAMLRSGLDRSKRPPSSLFYLPCQARDPKVSFFEILNPTGNALDAVNWVQHSAVEPTVPFERTGDGTGQCSRPINQEKVKAAITRWHGSTSHPGEGNPMFFQLGVDLRSAGMALGEIECTLNDEAGYGRSPAERKAQIKSIMATLRKSRG
jgi:hypothetical protein